MTSMARLLAGFRWQLGMKRQGIYSSILQLVFNSIVHIDRSRDPDSFMRLPGTRKLQGRDGSRQDPTTRLLQHRHWNGCTEI